MEVLSSGGIDVDLLGPRLVLIRGLLQNNKPEPCPVSLAAHVASHFHTYFCHCATSHDVTARALSQNHEDVGAILLNL